jgi:hypothetical protein
MGEENKHVWHLSRDGKQHGPISGPQLLRLAELGKLRPGFEAWMAVRSIPGLLTPPMAPLTPRPPEPNDAPKPNASPEQNGSTKVRDLKSLRAHYRPDDKEVNRYKKASTAGLLCMFGLPGLWAQDFTSTSVYWVARVPDNQRAG